MRRNSLKIGEFHWKNTQNWVNFSQFLNWSESLIRSFQMELLKSAKRCVPNIPFLSLFYITEHKKVLALLAVLNFYVCVWGEGSMKKTDTSYKKKQLSKNTEKIRTSFKNSSLFVFGIAVRGSFKIANKVWI